MKLAIAGATGFVGRETLAAAVQSDAVKSVLVLGRRPVAEGSPKVKEILIDDFGSYSEHVKAALADVDAFIWYVPAATGFLTIAGRLL